LIPVLETPLLYRLHFTSDCSDGMRPFGLFIQNQVICGYRGSTTFWTAMLVPPAGEGWGRKSPKTVEQHNQVISAHLTHQL